MKNGLHTDIENTKTWWLNNRLHRSDGPAIEFANRTKHWYVHGKLHRTDGPAVEYANGEVEWWTDDKFLGCNDKGFWALWKLLDDGQRSELNLLMWLPKI